MAATLTRRGGRQGRRAGAPRLDLHAHVSDRHDRAERADPWPPRGPRAGDHRRTDR